MPKVTPFLTDLAHSQRLTKATLQIDKIDNGGFQRSYANE